MIIFALPWNEPQKGDIFEWHHFVERALCGSIRLRDIDKEDRKRRLETLLIGNTPGETQSLQQCLQSIDFASDHST